VRVCPKRSRASGRAVRSGLSALDSSAQIVSWAIVFDYAQQLFTRFVDQQGDAGLDHVRSAPATIAHAAATDL
jgi:hypothetical protein